MASHVIFLDKLRCRVVRILFSNLGLFLLFGGLGLRVERSFCGILSTGFGGGGRRHLSPLNKSRQAAEAYIPFPHQRQDRKWKFWRSWSMSESCESRLLPLVYIQSTQYQELDFISTLEDIIRVIPCLLDILAEQKKFSLII